MNRIEIIMPVKDSLDTARDAIEAVLLTPGADLTVYNDFSTPENTDMLKQLSQEQGFRLAQNRTRYGDSLFLSVRQRAGSLFHVPIQSAGHIQKITDLQRLHDVDDFRVVHLNAGIKNVFPKCRGENIDILSNHDHVLPQP